MAGGMITLTAHNFEEIAMRDDEIPVLVDFWAPWCTPCHLFQKVLDELAEELEGKAIIGKVNIEEEPLLTSAVRIKAIPTLLLLRHGHLEDIIVGILPKEVLKRKLLWH